MENPIGKNPGSLRLPQIISDVFSPLLIPTYAYTIMMWLTPLVVLPERTRLVTMAVVALITAVLPTAAILTLRRLGKVSDNAISRRSERAVPFCLAFFCYLAAAWYLSSIHAPWWVARFFIGAALAVGIALIVTFRWKISAHATAVSGMAGMIIWLAFRHLLLLQPMIVITVGIMLCGAVCSSRLALHRHTFGQVGAGFLLGLGCVIAALLV
ncbi:MAG: hypothetical protein K2I56_08880 [Muribaculaceae bacterium]|nr:hypothetical protein [Muribaculaceae bacterium]